MFGEVKIIPQQLMAIGMCLVLDGDGETLYAGPIGALADCSPSARTIFLNPADVDHLRAFVARKSN